MTQRVCLDSTSENYSAVCDRLRDGGLHPQERYYVDTAFKYTHGVFPETAFAVVGMVIYVFCPAGISRAVHAVLERQLDFVAQEVGLEYFDDRTLTHSKNAA